mgnify:CR=1 FL=1
MNQNQVKTSWIQPKPQRAKPIKLVKVDPAQLQITDDKPVITRVPTGNKYLALFESMKIGQAIKCKPEETMTVAQAMRKWILETKDVTKLRVKAVAKYPVDGMGRVWLVQNEARK